MRWTYRKSERAQYIRESRVRLLEASKRDDNAYFAESGLRTMPDRTPWWV